MTSSERHLNRTLADLYGASQSTEAFVPLSLDPTTHAGALTLGAVLTKHANPEARSPIKRGVFVYRQLLCDFLPDPPASLFDEILEEPPPGSTAREDRASRTECSACHDRIDPVGYGMEDFDGVGRYRSSAAFDSNGILHDTTPFEGTAGLSRALASDPTARACFVRRTMQYALGIDLDDPTKTDWGQAVLSAFETSAGNYLRTLEAIVESPFFIERIGAQS